MGHENELELDSYKVLVVCCLNESKNNGKHLQFVSELHNLAAMTF